MKKLFVTTDLSPNSKTGIKFAIQFARQLRAELIFCHIAEIAQPLEWSDEHYKRFEKENISSKTTLLKEFIRKTTDGNTKLIANAKYVVQLSLDVDGTIIRTASKNKADFICMSTRGAGKVKKLFGTNASAIITGSPIPVVVVPQRYKAAKIDQLFFACDFGTLKQEMKRVQDLAENLKARIKVFHYDYLLNDPENARKLDRKADPFKSKNVSFNFRKLEIERTLTDHLKEDIKKEKPSMVILFTKQNRSWFDRLVLPSEAAEMSFNVNLPLLTFKKKPN